MQQLLKNGAEIESKNMKGQTILHLAARKRHDAVGRLLLEHKDLDINSKDTENGKTPLLYAKEGGYKTMMRLLLENGTSVEEKN